MKSSTREKVDSILIMVLAVIVFVQMWRESNYRAAIKALSDEVIALRSDKEPSP